MKILKDAVQLDDEKLIASVVKLDEGYAARLIVMSAAFDGEHTFRPAQSVQIVGEGSISALRDFLNKHFPATGRR